MSNVKIAAPPCKVQIFYNFSPTGVLGDGQAVPVGFSETYWVPSSLQTAAKTQAISICNTRMGATAPDVSVLGIRITDTSILRKPLLVNLNDPANAVTTVGTFQKTGQTGPQQSLHPELALMVRVTTSDLSYGMRWFHCPPAAIYLTQENINVSDAVWGPLWTNYLNAVKGTQLVAHGTPPVAKNITDVQFVGARSRRTGRQYVLFRGSRPAR